MTDRHRNAPPPSATRHGRAFARKALVPPAPRHSLSSHRPADFGFVAHARRTVARVESCLRKDRSEDRRARRLRLYRGGAWCGCSSLIRTSRLLCSPPIAGPARPWPTCFRNSRRTRLPTLTAIDAVDWAALGLDLVFCALPHGTTQKVIKDLLARAPGTKIVDLSADFRLADPGRLCALVRPCACRAGAATGGGVRPDRNLSAADQGGAARRQSRLLHDLRRARAHSAPQGQGDRSRRDRDRRQVRHDRSGQGGARGHAVRGSLRGLSRLRRRPSPAHGRARPGVFPGRRPRGDRQLHAASRADEPRHPLDDLRARPQGVAAGSSCAAGKGVRERAVRARAAVRHDCRRRGTCAART